MKRQSTVLTAVLVILLVAGLAGPALAQGLAQVFEWPEVGLTINYPAGWLEASLDSETRLLYSDPTYDIENSDEPPEAPAVLIMALTTELAEMMGGRDDLLSGFGSEFGVDAANYQEVTIAGQDALRVQTPVGAPFYADLVVIESASYFYVLMGVSAPEQAFAALFDDILDTLVISEPAEPEIVPNAVIEAPTSPALPLVNAVRITLDQTLTNAWNEIDAVELVGLDMGGSTIGQWATMVEATSQYTDDSWSAQQVLGEPDTFECGDISTAWASATSNGQDTLTVYYDAQVQPTAVNIYETYNPGAITLVEVLPVDGSDAIVIFEGVDPTTDCPGVFSIPVGPPSSGALTTSETISSSLDNTTYGESWAFDGAAGDIVTITMVATSGSLDPLLYLLDAGGDVLASNDDAEDTTVGSFNSQIAGFVLPATGTYTIQATRFGEEFGGTTGDYELTIDTGSPAMTTATVSDGTIAYGQTVSGEITNNLAQQDWTFTGTAGDLVTITMAADGMVSLDAYLQLLDSSGSELVANDDAGSEALAVFDSQIVGFSLPYSGQYIIRASRISGTGAYLLTLEAGAAAAGDSITYGETVTGSISEEEYRHLWTFEGAQGDVVTITMVDTSTTQALDSYLILLGPDGTEIASNDDAVNTSIGAFNAQIANTPLPASGEYTIVATRFGEQFGNGAGDYELSLRQGK